MQATATSNSNNKYKEKNNNKNAKRPFNFNLFWDFLLTYLNVPARMYFLYLRVNIINSLNLCRLFCLLLLFFELVKVVTFFKDMIWVKLASLQSVFYIFCLFVIVRK